MDIPALFASNGPDGLVCREAWFRGLHPVATDRTVGFDEAASGLPRAEERMPAVVADFGSLSSGAFREDVLKRMKLRSRDIWFMTWIETVDDVFDAFNTNADTVLGPYHSSASDDELMDIYSVSDSFVPTVFVSGGRAFGRGRMESLGGTLDRLADMGFYRACVLDTDDSVSDWGALLEDRPSLVPFTRFPSSTGAICRPWISCALPPRYRL